MYLFKYYLYNQSSIKNFLSIGIFWKENKIWVFIRQKNIFLLWYQQEKGMRNSFLENFIWLGNFLENFHISREFMTKQELLVRKKVFENCKYETFFALFWLSLLFLWKEKIFDLIFTKKTKITEWCFQEKKNHLQQILHKTLKFAFKVFRDPILFCFQPKNSFCLHSVISVLCKFLFQIKSNYSPFPN